MSGAMQATRRGRKHRCAACGAAFYDLERELSTCPKCETPYESAAHMPRGEPARKRRSWSKGAPRSEPEAPTAEAPAAEAGEDDVEGVPILDAAEDADEAEAADDADEESPATEDDEAETPGRGRA